MRFKSPSCMLNLKLILLRTCMSRISDIPSEIYGIQLRIATLPILIFANNGLRSDPSYV
jgi:hypothetical protein